MFADQAKIYIRSGKGGDGHVSFRRELYVPNGGPDGGDGGRGGDLIFEVDPGINTLNEFRHIRKYCAEDGEPGGKRRCHGKDGADLVVKVPAGTIVKEANSGQVITDMSYDNTREVILKGGRGGKGNQHYATPTMTGAKICPAGKTGDGAGSYFGIEDDCGCRTGWIPQCRKIHVFVPCNQCAAQDCQLSLYHIKSESWCGRPGRNGWFCHCRYTGID